MATPPAVPTVLTWTWPQYFAAVVRNHGRPTRFYGPLPVWTVRAPGWSSSSILQELDTSQGTVRTARQAGTFAGLSSAALDQVAGFGDPRLRWLGYMGRGPWPGRIRNNPALLDGLLHHTPGIPPLTALQGISTVTGPAGYPIQSLVTPIHWLTMVDPGHYFPVTSTNQCRMKQPWALGCYPTTHGAYDHLWRRVQHARWMTAPSPRLTFSAWKRWHCGRMRLPASRRPPRNLTCRIWAARAAYLDALFYDPK